MRVRKTLVGIAGLAVGLLFTLLLIASIFFTVGFVRGLFSSETTQEPVVKSYPYIYPTTTPEQLLELVNAERVSRGMNPLEVDQRLVQSATNKIDELIDEGWDSEPHLSDTGKHGYEYVWELWAECNPPSENLLVGHMDAKAGFDWWMNSEAHREAMLNPIYDYTGIAVKDYYVVQHFCNID